MDEAALRERYRIERDKRLRPEGNEQYLEPRGRFAGLTQDPYTEVVPREPVRADVSVAVIGAGFSGLVVAARLKQAGVDDVRLIDKAGDVGGVWYWNRYPGAMCDTAAMIYLPLLEETGTVPSAKYVPAPEIHAHAQRIATTFGLNDGALFSTEITEMVWQEDLARWLIRTDRGDELRARHVSMGTGPLHRPKLPGIDGIDEFAGHAFHTSRWDYAYTGGDAAGAPMTSLADRRVGIVGTGATAVQCIPHLAATAEQLVVFQRTPSSIDVRANAAIDPAWFADLDSGWQKRWLRNFATLQSGGFADEDLVMDGWTDIAQRIRDRAVALISAGSPYDEQTLRRAYEESDDDKMAEIRARVDAIVEDPATAEALKPWYRQLCKRPCFHDDYLQVFNQPNVRLVDTNGRGVERIDATGVWAGSDHHELDCIIFASGFEVGTDLARRSGFEVAGRDGVTLTDHWAQGMRTLHGTHVHGFPNLFVVGVAQNGALISNVPHNYVELADAIAAVVAHAEATGAVEVEVSAEAEAAWLDRISDGASAVFGDPDCTPGYYNNEGRPYDDAQRQSQSRFPDGAPAFFEYLEQWRLAGDFAGLGFARR